MRRMVLVPWLIILVMTACGEFAKPSKVSIRYPNAVSPQADSDFQNAEHLYQTQQYQAALGAYEGFLVTHLYNQLSDEAYYKLGKIYFLLNKYQDAIAKLETLATLSPDPAYVAKARLLVAYAHFRSQQYQASKNTLDQITPSDLIDRLKIRYHSLAILDGRALGRSDEDLITAFLGLIDAYHASSPAKTGDVSGADLITLEEAEKTAQKWAHTSAGLESLKDPWTRWQGASARGYVVYRMARIALTANDTSSAKTYLRQMLDAYPKHTLYQEAYELLTGLGGEMNLDADREAVGVLLPLSGEKSSYGLNVRKGMECATGMASTCQATSRAQLIFADTAANPETATTSLARLVRDYKVVAVLGPLTSAEAERLAPEAQALKVPLLVLTQKSGLTGAGEYIFQLGYPMDRQIDDTLLVAEGRGINRMAILHPQNAYGEQAKTILADMTGQSTVKLVASQGYDPTLAAITDDIRSLKLSVSNYRYGESATGFNALLIPDSFVHINQIIPELARSNIRGVVLIGTNAWNSPKLSLEIGALFPDSYFVDMYFAGSRRPQVAQFVAAFSQSYSYQPGTLEAMGYDAVGLVNEALKRSGDRPSRERFRRALTSLKNFQGVTGIKGFEDDRTATIEPNIITVTEQGLAELP